MSKDTIYQKEYSDLYFDFRESDIVMIWQGEGEEANVVQVERKNILPLIKALQEQLPAVLKAKKQEKTV